MKIHKLVNARLGPWSQKKDKNYNNATITMILNTKCVINYPALKLLCGGRRERERERDRCLKFMTGTANGEKDLNLYVQ